MSEQPAEYLGETPEQQEHFIRDESSPRTHYSMIPNLVDDLELSPHAYRLYGHLRRVAGESGKCWQSTSTLSKSCKMSAAMVSYAKAELEGTYPPLIRIISKKRDAGGIYHEIVITDVWQINHDYYTQPDRVHIVKAQPHSQCERAPSQCETKKNPLKQEEPSIDIVIDAMQKSGILPGSMTADFLTTWRAIHADARIIQAIEVSKGKNEKYINAVLRGWEKDGYPPTREERIAAAKEGKAQGFPSASPRPAKQTASDVDAMLRNWLAQGVPANGD
jgi:hypothetical protein